MNVRGMQDVGMEHLARVQWIDERVVVKMQGNLLFGSGKPSSRCWSWPAGYELLMWLGLHLRRNLEIRQEGGLLVVQILHCQWDERASCEQRKFIVGARPPGFLVSHTFTNCNFDLLDLDVADKSPDIEPVIGEHASSCNYAKSLVHHKKPDQVQNCSMS